MRKLATLRKILIACWAIVAGYYGWDTVRRHWIPAFTINTAHYTIYSSATREQTERVGALAESLYDAYGDFLRSLKITRNHTGKLKMKLFANREEFRFCNRINTWAEAFYQKPYCYQYFSADERNPYHWMLHEATHQLNEEAVSLPLTKWLNEGIADYFGTSLIFSNKLALGSIDVNTYPVWWVDMLARSGDLEADKKNESVIPLRAIISGSGGPDINKSFNLYYLHWWTLTHFLLHGQNGHYRDGVANILVGESGVEGFERHIGHIEQIEMEWYAYVRELKLLLRTRKQIVCPLIRPSND